MRRWRSAAGFCASVGMNTRRLSIFLLVVVALFGCRRNSKGQLVVDVPAVVAATVLGGGPLLLDPLATARMSLGWVTLRNDEAPGVEGRDIEFRVDCPPGYEASQYDAVLAPGEELAVEIFTTLVVAAILTVDVFAKYVRGSAERGFPIEWQNLAAGSRAFALLSLVSLPVFAVLWFTSAVLAPVGVLTHNSNPLVPRRVPALAQDVRLFGAVIGFLTLVQIAALFGNGALDDETFPPGQGPNGFTVAATPSAPMAAGEYVAFWMSVSADIPLDSQEELFQYAFVCDTDADPSNNYVPSPAFPDDFFGGTDRWYELSYAPSTGWTLTCKVVGPGNSITTVASGAKAILSGDTLLMLVPRSEFVVSNPPFRATTFAHKGDFGQVPPYDWSGDPTPTVDEGLQTWQ